ncbi:mCG1050926, partial [Mus musculus]
MTMQLHKNLRDGTHHSNIRSTQPSFVIVFFFSTNCLVFFSLKCSTSVKHYQKINYYSPS